RELEARQDRVEQRAAQAGRGAKKNWPPAGDGTDSFLRPFDLVGERAWPEYGKIVEMAVAVILDGMSAIHDLARELRVLLDTFADAEKSGFGTMLVEHCEH